MFAAKAALMTRPGAAFTPITIENTNVAAGTAIPAGASGVYVLIGGPGADGDKGSGAGGASIPGGVGGGAGARVYAYIPKASWGAATTYELTRGLAEGTNTVFKLGTVITLTAASGAGINAGVASQSGFPGATLANGTAGRNGSNGNTGVAAVAATNGAGTGGPSGGGARDSGGSTSYNGGNGAPSTGGTGDPALPESQSPFPGQPGNGGTGRRGSSASAGGAGSGYCHGGAGGGANSGSGSPGGGAVGMPGYSKLIWV